MYSRVLGIAVLVATTLTAFQNCGQPVAFNSVELTSTALGVVPPEPIPEKGDYSFSVQTNQKEHLPLVKLIMIVDNSNSMARYQDLLAKGVNAMLAKLKSQKLNVDFYLYTTSAGPGQANSSAEALPVEYVDVAGGSLTAAQSSGKPHVRKLKYRLAPSMALTSGKPLGFRSTMTDAEMTSISDQLEARIKAVGTNGSTSESGLCTMLRILKDSNDNKIVSAGDRVALVVLSDEDDSIKMENCFDSIEEIYKDVATDTRCSSTAADCKPPFIYRATYSNANLLRFTLVHDNPACVMDGGLTAACKQNRTVNIDCARSPGLCPTSAPNNMSVSCSSGQQSAASTALNINNAQVSSCRVVHSESIATFSLTNQMEKGLCGKSFTIGGVMYENVADFMRKKYPAIPADKWRDTCAEFGLVDVVRRTETVVKNSLLSTGSTAIEQLKATANAVLGENSYRMSFVINDTKANMNEMCPAGTENNKGLLYRALGDLLGSKQSFVASICAPNYDVAMGDLGKFIENIAARSYQLALTKPSMVESVSILRGGVTIPVDPSDFNFSPGQAANLTFKDGLLQPGDKVTVKWVEVL